MSGDQHLGWEALERIRTDEASAEEFAHLASCVACRESLADLERLASRFKESLVAGDDTIPAAREDAILAAARERAAAIAGKKLVRLPWWKQRSTMALAASLMVAGSAAYLTYLKKDEPSPRPVAKQEAREVRNEADVAPRAGSAPAPAAAQPGGTPDYGLSRDSAPAKPPARAGAEIEQKKEREDAGRLDDEERKQLPREIDALGKSALADRPAEKPMPEPAASRSLGSERSGAKGDATKSKDADRELRDLAAAPPPPSSTVTAAPGTRAPVPEPPKPPVMPAAPPAGAVGGVAAGASGPSKLAEVQAAQAEGEGADKLVGALDAREEQAERRKFWMPPRTGLWSTGTAEQRDVTTPEPLKLISTEIEVRVGDTVARRVRQRFSNPSGQPIVATYSTGIAPGERADDLSLTIGANTVPPQPSQDMTHVRVWQDLPIAGTTIDVTTLSPPRPLEGAPNGSVRVRLPVPPPPPQVTDDPPKLAIRLEPAQGYRIGQPSAAGLAITGHPLGSGAWDLTLPPTLGVKEDLLELDVPIVKSGG